MIKIKNDYATHRDYWRSKEYLKRLFGNNVDIKSAVVQDFLDTIDSIPENPTYTIAAYGSLLNTSDIFRTMPTASNFRIGHIYGFTRIFNMGVLGRGCVLNIQHHPDEQKDVICNFIDISYEDLPEYILREGWYNIEVLEPDQYYDPEGEANDFSPVLTVIGDQSIVNRSIGVEPQLNYLHLCLTGMKEIGGWEGIQQFLGETLCYSKKARDYVSVKQWLFTTDMVDYMITNDYSKR